MKVYCLILIWLLFFNQAWAGDFVPGLIEGKVTTEVGAIPIAMVDLDINIESMERKSNVAQTDSFGRYKLDLAKLFPKIALKGKTITIIFHKKNYLKANRLLSLNPENISQFLNLDVSMSLDYSILEKEEQSKLKSKISEKGYTLFLIPYQISENNKPDLVAFDIKKLSDFLFIALTTHLQALELKEYPDISISSLDLNISWTETERVRTIGSFLNALAMVGGTGEIRSDESQKKLVHIFSWFVTIPFLRGYQSAGIVEDTLPIELLQSPLVAKKINRLWLSHAVLALSRRDFVRAKSTGDRQVLEQVRSLLIAEKATRRIDGEQNPNEKNIIVQINSLLEEIKQELRP